MYLNNKNNKNTELHAEVYNAPPGQPVVCKRSKVAAVLVIATSPVLKAVNNQLQRL